VWFIVIDEVLCFMGWVMFGVIGMKFCDGDYLFVMDVVC